MSIYNTEDRDQRLAASRANPRDVRYLKDLKTFVYDCRNCGPQYVQLDPDYPYAVPANEWTCIHCAGVMKLNVKT